MEHTKRYMVIFDIWTDRTFSEEKNEFDTEKEWKEYVSLINSIYENAEPSYDRYGKKKEWGYVVLDFVTENILKWSSTGKIFKASKVRNKLELKDIFFRGENEIPKNYQWDDGEYEGWLQYRWGDGKNAIDYEERKQKTTKKNDKIQPLSEEVDEGELLQDLYDKKLTRERIMDKIDKW